MNIPDEINRRLSKCAQQTSVPQRKKNIEGFVQYVENIAKRRLGSLTAFMDVLDDLWSDHPIRGLVITEQIEKEYNDLEYAVRSAEGFLVTFKESP